MLYLEVSNKRVHVPAGITAQVVHKSAYFTDGLEDSFSLPFEVPVQGNEAVMGHVHELPLRSRITSFEAAQLGHQGLPLYRGTLHVLSSTPHSVRGSFSIDGFVQRVKGVMLPDALRGELIDLTDELVNQGISLSLRPQYADGGKCQFPMYRNTELYGDANPDWYPNASAWDATTSYVTNDLVKYSDVEPSTGVLREDIWQCVSPVVGGLGPADDPTHWRRTSFGLVNAWDRASNQHHYNTLDGNFYAHVPWFYLKWVLKKALAHVGYTPVGEWMADERTHELVMANNTTIDRKSIATDDYAFRASQTTPVAYAHDGSGNPIGGYQAFRIPGQNDSTDGNYDISNVWDSANSLWTCPDEGTFRFRIRVTMNQRANDRLQFRMHRADGSTFRVEPYTVPAAEFAAGGGPAPNLPLTVVHEFAVVLSNADIGTSFYFLVHQTTSPNAAEPFSTAVMFPNNIYASAWGTQVMTSCRIIGWLQAEAATVSTPDTEIHPWRHVPEVDLYGFIVAIADAFNLAIEPDEAMRTLRLNYKERELIEQERRVTHHSERVINDVEIDHQRRTMGVVLRWDAETHNLADEQVENAEFSYTESDLTLPLTTGKCHVCLATRAIYRSGLYNGVLAWQHQGYLVPDKRVGDSEGAIEVKPAVRPVHMVQDQLEGKEYLIPELSGLGTSAWFRTDGDKGTIWITEFKKQSSSDGTVTNVPGARSWGYGWDADDRSRLTLLWDQPDAELPGLYQTCWQRWLAMLTTAEPVTMDLLVDPAFLKGRDWRHTLLLHGQRYLVQELPVTYGDHGGQLMSEGAYLLRLRPTGTDPLATVPEPEACENPAEVRWSPAIGLVTIVGAEVADTHFAVAVDGAEPVLTPKEETLYLDPAAGNVRAYACDAAGTQACRIIQVIIAGGGGIDLDLSDAGDMLSTLQADGVNTLIMPPAHTLIGVWITESALDEATVDALLNSLDDTMADGIVDLSGGTTAAPSAASLAKRTALLANGWTITTN